jgi:hypothetical protein
VKHSLQLVLVAVLACFVGSLAGPTLFESVTNAQPPLDGPGDTLPPEQLAALLASQPTKGPRFQISAYGHDGGHGCYIIDMTTGRFWHSVNYSQPKRVGSVRDAEPQN